MNLPESITLNQNAAECIKHASSVGHTTYTNICNGTVTVVSWGSADWITALGMSFFIGVIFLATVFLVWKITRDDPL